MKNRTEFVEKALGIGTVTKMFWDEMLDEKFLVIGIKDPDWNKVPADWEVDYETPTTKQYRLGHYDENLTYVVLGK